MDGAAARVLARLADGGLRDGLSLLDQCASATTGELNADRVYACLGIAGIQQCGKLMGYIAQHDTANALSLLNQLYSKGKDMGALLDELSCLTRDLMVMKTAPQEGINMLSGVTTEQEVKDLTKAFSVGELSRMLNLIQQTVAGFSRSASRRMDAELCIINLCQPELNTDMESVLARLTNIEDRIRAGNLFVAEPSRAVDHSAATEEETISQQEPEQEELPPDVTEELVDSAPVGFWTDVATAVRNELSPAMKGFFATTPNAPLRGVLTGDKLTLLCANQFVMEIVNKPDVLSLVTLKASARIGRPIRVVVADQTASPGRSSQIDELLNFGRAHSNIITIKD